MYYIQFNSSVNNIKEPIISYDIIQSDIDKCEYKTILRSEHLIYTHCSSISSFQSELQGLKDGTIVNLVRMFDYTNIADHYEVIKKHIIKKDKK